MTSSGLSRPQDDSGLWSRLKGGLSQWNPKYFNTNQYLEITFVSKSAIPLVQWISDKQVYDFKAGNAKDVCYLTLS